MFRFLARVVRSAWKDPVVRGVMATIVMLLVLATVFYTVVEGWSVLDSIYFAVITGLSIGYGDLVPESPIAKIFTMFYALLAVGLFVALATSLAKAALERKSREKPDDD
jgi:hypothetical protein